MWNTVSTFLFLIDGMQEWVERQVGEKIYFSNLSVVRYRLCMLRMATIRNGWSALKEDDQTWLRFTS